MTEYVYIDVEVNLEGKLGGQWSTTHEGATPSIGDIVIKVEAGSPASHGDFSGYRYIDGELTFSEELFEEDTRESEIASQVSWFKHEMEDFHIPFKVADGEIEETINSSVNPDKALNDYFLGYSSTSSTYYNKFENNSNTPTKVTEVTIEEQFHLKAYIRAVNNHWLDKIDNKLVPLMESKETVEEIREVKWDDVPDEPLPDQDSVEPDKPTETPLLKELREIKERLTKLEEPKD